MTDIFNGTKKKLGAVFGILCAGGKTRYLNKLNDELATAVFWQDETRVRSVLDQGANPNIFLIDGRQHLLTYALNHCAVPEIFHALLEAGADVRHPYVNQVGDQSRLSDAAIALNRPQQVADAFKTAETQAVATHGPFPPLKDGTFRSCPLLRRSA